MPAVFRFALNDLPPEAESLRAEVRDFLRKEFSGAAPVKRAKSWGGFDREFSRRVGARGWIGMTWPKAYGGHERSFLERYVVMEEMLAAGAPVSAHWVADRQSGPLLLRFGTEEQRQRILPGIVRGELAFAIGMSEPDSGSDLASIRTRATKTDSGYLVNGTKVWTSNAHLSDYAISLFRTQIVPDKKHEGLTQFLVDLRNTQGITIRPIIDLAGKHHFNEVNFTDAFVPDQARVGSDGDGRKVASLATLRAMSTSVAGMLQAGEAVNLEAAAVKDVGTTFEQSVPELAHALLDVEPTLDTGSDLQQVLGYITQTAPSFSLRGGTREILRGIIARGLGLR